MYFFSTTDVVAGKAPKDTLFRLGGMVIKGSVERPGDGMMVRFKLTDFSKDVTVEYTGILPDLFREGQGIVAHGKLNAQGVFIAEEVLAKHDENYMPPEVKRQFEKPAGAGCRPKIMIAELGHFALILALCMAVDFRDAADYRRFPVHFRLDCYGKARRVWAAVIHGDFIRLPDLCDF